MAYEPLTQEQFQKARKAGFTPEKIIAMEQKRKEQEDSVDTQNKEPGFVQGAVQGFAKPFLRTAATGLTALGGAMDIGKSLIQKAQGKDAEAQATLDESRRLQEQGDTKGYDLGYFGNIKPLQNPLEAAGAGIEIASNIPIVKGAGLTYNVLKNATKQGGAEAFKRAIVPLIKEGAFAGGSGNLGRSLQEGDSAGETALNTALGTVIGAGAAPIFGAGAAVGGNILGKTVNPNRLFAGVEPKITVKQTQKQLENIADYVRPPLDKVEKASLRKATAESNYTGFAGLGVKKYNLQDQDYLRAQAVKDLVQPGFNKSNENIARISQNVEEVFNNDLIPFLKENPSPYNFNEFNDYMNSKVKPSLLLKGEGKTAVFDEVKNAASKIILKYPPTTEGLQLARIEIDKMIDAEFGDAIWNKTSESHTAVKQAVLKFRKAVNDFTADSIKFRNMTNFNKAEDFINTAQMRGMKFDNIEQVREELIKHFGTNILPENELKAILFRNKLKNMNLKLEAVDNIWDNASTEIGKNRLQNFFKDPLLSKAAGYGGAIAGGTALGSLWYKGGGNNTN